MNRAAALLLVLLSSPALAGKQVCVDGKNRDFGYVDCEDGQQGICVVSSRLKVESGCRTLPKAATESPTALVKWVSDELKIQLEVGAIERVTADTFTLGPGVSIGIPPGSPLALQMDLMSKELNARRLALNPGRISAAQQFQNSQKFAIPGGVAGGLEGEIQPRRKFDFEQKQQIEREKKG